MSPDDIGESARGRRRRCRIICAMWMPPKRRCDNLREDRQNSLIEAGAKLAALGRLVAGIAQRSHFPSCESSPDVLWRPHTGAQENPPGLPLVCG